MLPVSLQDNVRAQSVDPLPVTVLIVGLYLSRLRKPPFVKTYAEPWRLPRLFPVEVAPAFPETGLGDPSV